MLKVKATPIFGKDLKPGDLFSTVGPDYWEDMNRDSIGERVYIRTDTPCPKSQENEEIFLIEITR